MLVHQRVEKTDMFAGQAAVRPILASPVVTIARSFCRDTYMWCGDLWGKPIGVPKAYKRLGPTTGLHKTLEITRESKMGVERTVSFL